MTESPEATVSERALNRQFQHIGSELEIIHFFSDNA
jgi:hypothetical protein